MSSFVHLSDLKLIDLKRILDERDEDSTGTKSILQKRLRQVLIEAGEDPKTTLFETGKPLPELNMQANRYATKKTIAQGMLDIALLSANASQLKYVLQVGRRHEFYTLLLVLISASIILQVGSAAFLLLFNLLVDCRLHLVKYRRSAKVVNYITVCVSFSVTVINVLISAFDSGYSLVPPDDQQ